MVPNQPMIMASVYLLTKKNVQQICTSIGILERESTCEDSTEAFPIYECWETSLSRLDRKDQKTESTKNIHHCQTHREADKMRTASCKPEAKSNQLLGNRGYPDERGHFRIRQ